MILLRDNIAYYLSQPRFENISLEIKSLLHKILHEFHFLYSIKAHELFETKYMQPGESLTSSDKNLAAFDDELVITFLLRKNTSYIRCIMDPTVCII